MGASAARREDDKTRGRGREASTHPTRGAWWERRAPLAPPRPHGLGAGSGVARVRACVRGEDWARQMRREDTIRGVPGLSTRGPKASRGARGSAEKKKLEFRS